MSESKPEVSKMTRIPDPNCRRCDGVGWYEGGVAIQTHCSCLRHCTLEEAQVYVLDGSYRDWKQFYKSLPETKGNSNETRT